MRRIIFLTILIVTIFPLTIINCEPDQGDVLLLEINSDSDWNLININSSKTIKLIDYNITCTNKIKSHYITQQTDKIQISIQKEAFDQSPVKLFVSLLSRGETPELGVKIEKGFIGITNITLEACNGSKFNTLKSITHSNVPKRVDTNPYSTIIKLGPKESSLLKIKSKDIEVPKLALAFYYPWYSTPEGSGVDFNHWEPSSNQTLVTSPNYPLLDLYDSQDPTLQKTHINMGIDAGIDAFICSWSGINTPEDKAIEGLVKIAAEHDFEIGVYYESLRGNQEELMDSDQIIQEISYIINKFHNNPGYFHIKGKPVIFIYQAETPQRSPEFWHKIITEVEKKTSEAIFIGDFRQERFYSEFEGVHTYNELDFDTLSTLTQVYSKNSERLIQKTLKNILDEIKNKGYIELDRKIRVGTVVPGYNDTLVRTPGQTLPRDNLNTYRKYWQNIYENNLDWVIITSFNEWHEATEIEPSNQHKFKYLTETRKQIARFKQINEVTLGESSLIVKTNQEENGLQVKLQNIGDENLYALRLEIPNIDFIKLLPLLSKGETQHFDVPLSSNLEGELSIICNYYDLAGIELRCEENHTLSDPPPAKADSSLTPPDTTESLEIYFEEFMFETNEHMVNITASVWVIGKPDVIEYCSLDILMDDEVIYGESWTELVQNANPPIVAPSLIEYTKSIEIPEGNHTFMLRAYARNNETQIIRKSNSYIINQPEKYLDITIPDIQVYQSGSNIFLEPVAYIQSYPSKLEYVSLDLLLNGTLIYSECWSDMDLSFQHNNGVMAPVNISYNYGFTKPDDFFQLELKSYARNTAQMGNEVTKIIYQSQKPVNPIESPYETDTTPDQDTPIKGNIIQHTLSTINDYRLSNNLEALTLNTDVLAQEYAEKMLVSHDFRHNPGLPMDVGENIGMMRYYSHYYTAEEAVSRIIFLMMYKDEAYNWDHREMILNTNFSSVSIGVAYDDEYIYLVKDFFR